MSVKTTKETCNQDITFKKNAYVEGSFIVPTFYDIYGGIDGERYSLGDYMSGTYVPIKETITMHPKIISIDNNANLYLGHVIDILPNNSFAIFNDTTGVYFQLSNNYFTGKNAIFNFGYTGNTQKFSIDVRNNQINYYDGISKNDNKLTKVKFNLKHFTQTVTMAFIEDINAVASLALANTTGHQYTATIPTDKKVELIIDINASYTASVNIAKGLRTAFQMCYGTTSDDVATCFASMDSNGLVTIDLDNVQLASVTPTCSYVIYN